MPTTLGGVHGLQNLYVVDGSVLPRSSHVNPLLSIYAWVLRIAERLAAVRTTREPLETPVEILA